MGTVLRAVCGIAIALAVYSPRAFSSVFDTPSLMSVKAQLSAAHPADKVGILVEDGLRRLPGARTAR